MPHPLAACGRGPGLSLRTDGFSFPPMAVSQQDSFSGFAHDVGPCRRRRERDYARRRRWKRERRRAQAPHSSACQPPNGRLLDKEKA
ncbi:hypothetical protein AAFF_G00100810 [Aldrovandia affinis]|uniref:Uncharacterized protein n=1 Tax=Aldrovandia affinis TaxID=143900 RepID=A0AAD7WB72_9TELE|nr:hypothetical protein AAFF_G00100810 [Aldrovandia affinis]